MHDHIMSKVPRPVGSGTNPRRSSEYAVRLFAMIEGFADIVNRLNLDKEIDQGRIMLYVS